MIRDVATGIGVLRHRLDGFPLISQSSKAVLDMGITPTEVVGIFKRELYDPGRSVEDQPSVNYHMPRATTYDPVTRRISNLNPLLADGDEVIIQYEDRFSTLVSIDSNPMEFRFVDTYQQPLEYDSIFYRLVAVKLARVGNGDNEFIRVPSRPTATIKLSLFDATPPEPPHMEVAQWSLGGEEPAIELVWTSQGGRFCLLQRKAADTVRWKSVGDWVGPTVTSNEGARFEFRDVGVDPQVGYRYRTIVRNRFGRTNTVFIEIEVNPINGGVDA